MVTAVEYTLLDVLAHPLGIFVVSLGASFLIPLFYRAYHKLAVSVFLLTLISMVLISASTLAGIIHGGPAFNIETAGIAPPFSINLRFGLFEGWMVAAVNMVGLLAALHYLAELKKYSSTMLLYVIMVMGINGMIMTRDLFNLFIFIEITSIATYALIGMQRGGSVLAAGFKYIIATSIASAFFLLGTTFIYYQTGTLNIDDIIQHQSLITGPVGLIATAFLVTSIIIELKPYPANGWGLDVYETAPPAIASMISVGTSSGMLFALYKLLPLFSGFLDSLIIIAGLTFLFSNFIGLKQQNARRLLGYSSIGQVALIMLAMILLWQFDEQDFMLLVVGGLFINHLLAKAGLFWLSAIIDKKEIKGWSSISNKTVLQGLFVMMIVALVGLPPFPGFWAKWGLVMVMADHHLYGWLAVVLFGSLLEAAYLFRWFCYIRDKSAPTETTETTVNKADQESRFWRTLPVLIIVLLLFAGGYTMSEYLDVNPNLYLPLIAGAVLWLMCCMPNSRQLTAMFAAIISASYLLLKDTSGIAALFAILMVAGTLVISLSSLYRSDQRNGFYPLLAVLVLSLTSLLMAETGLEFFFAWELMTLSSYFLVSLGRDGMKPSLTYLLFSLFSAYCLLAGFGIAYDATGSILLTSLGDTGAVQTTVFGLFALAFFIKMAGLGMHVWLPGAYAESDDDFSAIMSAVVSKAGVYGLMITAAYLGVYADPDYEPSYLLGWAGILTATFGAMMAVFQEDIKHTLAYSSMGQLGYIITGVALMNHLGWVAALYMTVNHFLFKSILFLSAAGIIMRTNQRLMYKMGGLIKNMPFTFVFVMIAIIAMSGVPPLSGYGGKWLLFNALMDKGWYLIAAFAFFSSAVAFLYMFRILHTVFLGQRKLEHRELREAPLVLLIPQAVMVGAIMFISAYPKLLLDSVSAAIAPWVGGQLAWDGLALQTHYGYWNAPMIMIVVAAVWMVPLIILLLASLTMKIQKVEQFNIVYAAERPHRPEDTHFAHNFFAHYDRALGFLVRPRATTFWNGVSEWGHTVGASLRIFYTGNGQTYALFILVYLVAIFLVNGGLDQ